MIIDDGYLRKGKTRYCKGYEHCRDHQQTIIELTSDRNYLLQELSPVEITHEINRNYIEVISQLAEQLITSHPDLVALMRNHIDQQSEENQIIEDQIVGAWWLLQKGDGK